MLPTIGVGPPLATDPTWKHKSSARERPQVYWVLFGIRPNLKVSDANLVNAKFDKVKQLLIKGYGRFIGDAGSPLSSQGHCLVWVGTFSHKRLVATHRTSDTSTKASPHPLEVHEEEWDNVAWNQG